VTQVRTSIVILAATLALTVFMTSLVLENRGGRANTARARIGGLDAIQNNQHLFPGRYGLTPQTAVTTPRADGAETKVNELLVQAQRFCDAGNLEGAAELLRAALKVDPDHVVVLDALGATCFALHQYAEAETLLRRVIEQRPDPDNLCRMRLGVAEMRQGKYGPALDNFKLVLQHDPTDGSVHFALACVFARLGETDRALYHLELAYAQMGPTVLAHISDPLLDSLRQTRKFQQIVDSARRQCRNTTVSATAPRVQPGK